MRKYAFTDVKRHRYDAAESLPVRDLGGGNMEIRVYVRVSGRWHEGGFDSSLRLSSPWYGKNRVVFS